MLPHSCYDVQVDKYIYIKNLVKKLGYKEVSNTKLVWQ